MLTIVLQSTYLSWFHCNDGTIAHLQFPHAIREIEGKLPLDEQAIHAIVVQAMTEGRQLVVMDNADQRVQHWCIHKTSIVVGGFNLQNIPHIGGKDTQNNLIMVCILRFLSTFCEIGI